MTIAFTDLVAGELRSGDSWAIGIKEVDSRKAVVIFDPSAIEKW